MIDSTPTPTRIVTRFAPSPTGNLHIGGARTALFNWAFTRRHGGTFILRIEDTDKKRSTPESTWQIIKDLRWLGLNWDEGPDLNADDPYTAAPIGTSEGSWNSGGGPYFQSQRLDLYNEHIQKLVDTGRAYKCFKTPDELAAERTKAKAEKRPYKYDGTESRNLTADQIAQYEDQGKPCVVRFAMPQHDITVSDLVLGDVTVKAAELEDFIIQKSDGYPTFHLANVVDDALMGITHVLRAQEHLMNTPKHVALQKALGFAPPHYAHMPLIFNADGSKMSKRDKAKVARAVAKDHLRTKTPDEQNTWCQHLADIDKRPTDLLPAKYHRHRQFFHPVDHIFKSSEIKEFIDKKNDAVGIAHLIAADLDIDLPEIDVQDFRASGYLPEVLLNYLSLLGWSPGNDLERFDLEFLKQNFNLERIGKSNARFDRAKLLAFNTEAIGKLDPDDFYTRLKKHDADFHDGIYMGTLGQERFQQFANAYLKRSQTLEEPLANGKFFIFELDTNDYDEKAVKKVLRKNDNEGFGVLGDLRDLLHQLGEDDWTVQRLEKAIKGYAEDKGLGLGKVAQPLRVAVSGSTISPPIYDTLAILGKKFSLANIDLCLRKRAQSPAP